MIIMLGSENNQISQSQINVQIKATIIKFVEALKTKSILLVIGAQTHLH